jgi:putative DNA primase/helicase
MRASTVTPRAVDWLLYPYVPLGKITVIAGQMGQAKSLLTCWFAAYTNARGGGVIMLSAEDDPADTVRPRLEAAGADLDRVEIAELVSLDLQRLNEIADDLGDVKLVTIDPIQAYMGAGINAWKGQDVRIALEPARLFAAERGIAVVLIQHLNRRTDGDPLARIADSQGIPQLARSVLVWGPDPSDPEGDNGSLKALVAAKANLARGATASATFRIEERTVTGGLTAPTLIRGDDSQITAGDLVADAETRTAQDEASEWLQQILADGPVAAKDVLREAKANGFSDRTLNRAKTPAGVVSEQNRGENGIKGWIWRLKDANNHSYTNGNVGYVGNLGNQGKVAKNAKDAKNATQNEVTDIGAHSLPAGWDDDQLQALVDAEKVALS